MIKRKVRLSDCPEGTRVCGADFYGSRRGKAWRDFREMLDALAAKYGAVFGAVHNRKDLWSVVYFLVPPLDANHPAMAAEAKKLSALNPLPDGVDVYAYDPELDEDTTPEDDEDEDEEN